jgi:hypothetical protein
MNASEALVSILLTLTLAAAFVAVDIFRVSQE